MILSVVVAVPGGSQPGAFLEALAGQPELFRGEVEVLLAQDNSGPLSEAPDGAQLLTVNGRASIFGLWGAGLRAASGGHVAFLDVRCPPRPGWGAAVLAALRADVGFLFGPVDCAWPPTDMRFIGYLTEYVQFYPPIAPGLAEVPGVNAVIRRDIASAPGVLDEDGFVKGRALAHVQRDALARPRALPEAVVTYAKPYGFRAYGLHRYRHGRCYGADRVADSPSRRWRYVFSTPLVPGLRIWRILRHARRTPGATRALGRWAHHVVAAEVAWSFGELMGYLRGEGDCRPRLG